MHARTGRPAQPQHWRGDDEDEEELAWTALRKRAEQRIDEAPIACGFAAHADTPGSAADAEADEWESLRLRAELELAAARYEAEASRISMRAFASPPPLPPRPARRSSFVSTPMMALDALEVDALEWSPRARRAWPVLVPVVACALAIGSAFVRQLAVEAEQQARVEQTLREIQDAHSQTGPAATTQSAMEAVARPHAEAPKSETLAALLRMNTPSAPAPIAARATSAVRGTPKRSDGERSARTVPATQATRGLSTRGVETPRPSLAEREAPVSTSDDPLFGL